jgi:type II secretory pathway component GspD/PulD (secretin)
MVNVTMDIYTVKDSDGDQQGLNWNVIFSNLASSYRINSASPASLVGGASAGSYTLTSLAGESAGSNAVFQALRSTGKSVQHKPVSLTTNNGQMKVQSSTSSQGYVKETTPGVASASGAAGAPGLKTDTVTTGDVFSVLPIIQPDNSVALKYSFHLSNLLNIANFTSGTGTSQQTVQVPQTDSVGDSSRVRLAPGEALMITGLSRLLSSTSNARVGDNAPMVFGGSTNNNVSREHFVVVVRAIPL